MSNNPKKQRVGDGDEPINGVVNYFLHCRKDSIGVIMRLLNVLMKRILILIAQLYLSEKGGQLTYFQFFQFLESKVELI